MRVSRILRRVASTGRSRASWRLGDNQVFGMLQGGDSRVTRLQKETLPETHRACDLSLSKISKCLSGWGYVSFIILADAYFSRHSSQLCLRSSVRVLPSGSRTWLCATKSACFSDLRENAQN